MTKLKAQRFLEEYSPIALILLTVLFFFPMERRILRTLILLGTVLPGLLTLWVKPVILKNPVFLTMILFILYFSLEDIRGTDQITFLKLKYQALRAILLAGPALLLAWVSPKRNTYPYAMCFILITCTACCIGSLVHFYSENLFPAQRFVMPAGITHPLHSAMKCAFAALFCSSYFLLNRPVTKWITGLTLTCFSITLFAMLMSHVRTAIVAFFGAIIISFIFFKVPWKKVGIAIMVITVTLTAYFATLQLAELPGYRKEHIRPEGAFQMSNTSSFNGRIPLWKVLISQMDSSDWLIGKGLGKNYYQATRPPHVTGFYMSPHGYLIHPHSGYMWALYFGGLVGLSILLLLAGSAGITSLKAGQQGMLACTLITFCTIFSIAGTKALLCGVGGTSYLTLWVPLGLAVGSSFNK